MYGFRRVYYAISDIKIPASGWKWLILSKLHHFCSNSLGNIGGFM